MYLTMDMMGDVAVLTGCMIFGALVLYLAYTSGRVSNALRSDLEGEPLRKRESKVKREVKPLIVGREYLVNDGENGPQPMVYFGKNMDKSFDFVDLGHIDDGSYTKTRIKTHNGESKYLFLSGDVRWIPDNIQSKVDCPRIEEGGGDDKTKREEA